MAFPTGLPSYLGFTAGHTLLADTHAAQHNQEQADIIALATKVGTGSSTPTNNKVLRGNGTGTSIWGQVDLTADVTNTLPLVNGGTGATTAAGVAANLSVELGKLLYPIGCIYAETTGVNPATTFGFGTWVTKGAGRVLVGAGTSDQVFTAGATGGESTHVLTSSEVTSHRHNWQMALWDVDFSPNGANAGMQPGGANAGGAYKYSTSSYTGGVSDGAQVSGSAQNSTTSTQTMARYASLGDTDTQTHVSNGSAHNNLQPYEVVYYWTRTA